VIYDYVCAAHGPFELVHLAPKKRSPKPCPRCGALSRPIVAVGTMSNGFRPYEEWNLQHGSPLQISSAAQLDREADVRGLRIQGGGGLSRTNQRLLEDYHRSVQKAIDNKR